MSRGKGIQYLPWTCVLNTLDHCPKENRIDNAVTGSSPIEIIRYAIIGFHCLDGFGSSSWQGLLFHFTGSLVTFCFAHLQPSFKTEKCRL